MYLHCGLLPQMYLLEQIEFASANESVVHDAPDLARSRSTQSEPSQSIPLTKVRLTIIRPSEAAEFLNRNSKRTIDGPHEPAVQVHVTEPSKIPIIVRTTFRFKSVPLILTDFLPRELSYQVEWAIEENVPTFPTETLTPPEVRATAKAHPTCFFPYLEQQKGGAPTRPALVDHSDLPSTFSQVIVDVKSRQAGLGS
jgi:hypothetical protein